MPPRPAHQPPCWFVPDPGELIWASWDGAYVAYHRPSGKTHFLNAASHELLTELLCKPQDFEGIATELEVAEAGDASASAWNRHELATLLNRLEQIGLVRRA